MMSVICASCGVLRQEKDKLRRAVRKLREEADEVIAQNEKLTTAIHELRAEIARLKHDH